MIADIVIGPIGFSVGAIAGLGLMLFAGMLAIQQRRSRTTKDLPRLLRKRAAMREVFITFSHPDIV